MSKIFIVDDSKVFRFTVSKLFGFTGFKGELTEFESAIDFIDYLKANKADKSMMPDLVLLDINMPSVNGFDCLAALEKMGKPFNDLIVKILSSSIDKEDMAKAQEFTQVKGFIIKPLTPVIVKSIIDSVEEKG